MADIAVDWPGREYCVELIRLARITKTDLQLKTRLTHKRLKSFLTGDRIPPEGLAIAIEKSVLALARTPKVRRRKYA